MSRVDRAAFDSWPAYYRHYQTELARRVLVPLLEENGVAVDGKRVLDLGCGVGGCAAAFAERAAYCLGIDVGEFQWVGAANLEFRRADALDPAVAESVRGGFDIVLLRDVIEHVGDKLLLLSHAAGALRGGGHALVSFPPYWSPYGAHQQSELRPHRLRFLPYLHGHPALAGIRRTRMTVAAFERVAREAGFRVLARRLYVARPSATLRYGIPTIVFPLPWLAGVREVVCTGATYVLERDGGPRRNEREPRSPREA
jgi:2-polyprenyl-3-methyl-5-hydroxy-6-metoxy-1,4-benzoquinol methylase